MVRDSTMASRSSLFIVKHAQVYQDLRYTSKLCNNNNMMSRILRTYIFQNVPI